MYGVSNARVRKGVYKFEMYFFLLLLLLYYVILLSAFPVTRPKFFKFYIWAGDVIYLYLVFLVTGNVGHNLVCLLYFTGLYTFFMFVGGEQWVSSVTHVFDKMAVE